MSERDAFGNELPRGRTGAGSGEPEASAAFGEPVGPEAADTAPAAARPAAGSPIFDSGASAHPPVASAGSAFEEAPVVRTPRANRSPGISAVPRAVGGCISFVAIILVVGGCAVAGLVGSIGDGVDTFRSISTEFSRTAPAPPAGSVTEAPSRRSTVPPRGLKRGSLLRRAAFSRAVTKLRRAGLGRPRSLRVAPDRINTQLVSRTGRLRSVQIVSGGALRTLSTTTSGGFPARDLVSLAAIDRGAPERLARSAAGRARLPTTRIDYLVLVETGGVQRWLVFFRNGPAYQADRTGRIERSVR